MDLEPTPELYVEHLVSVFREVRRVLKPRVTLWLNLGDSYAGNGTPATPLGLAAWSASIGFGLNPDYLEQIRQRCTHVACNLTTEEVA